MSQVAFISARTLVTTIIELLSPEYRVISPVHMKNLVLNRPFYPYPERLILVCLHDEGVAINGIKGDGECGVFLLPFVLTPERIQNKIVGKYVGNYEIKKASIDDGRILLELSREYGCCTLSDLVITLRECL